MRVGPFGPRPPQTWTLARVAPKAQSYERVSLRVVSELSETVGARGLGARRGFSDGSEEGLGPRRRGRLDTAPSLGLRPSPVDSPFPPRPPDAPAPLRVGP